MKRGCYHENIILFLRLIRHQTVSVPECYAVHLSDQSLTKALIEHELIKMRRLGQTHLTVKPGQVGTSNATKPENLGMFDYAHLKAPLPKNLQGSEIFAPNQHQPQPEAYFLMVCRRTRLKVALNVPLIICTNVEEEQRWIY